MHSVFYLLTPPGVTVCLDEGGAAGHCSRLLGHRKKKKKKKSSKARPTNTASAATTPTSTRAVSKPVTPTTILYGVIPWTAGGVGDGQFAAKDQVEAPYCQDGGFNPTTEPIEQHERNRSAKKKKKKFEEMTEEEKEKFDRRRRSSRPARAGAQPAAELPEPRRLVRHRPGGPDHQPDRGRAAEHRHRPAAATPGTTRPATRSPTSAATSSRRLDGQRRREPGLGRGHAVQPEFSASASTT